MFVCNYEDDVACFQYVNTIRKLLSENCTYIDNIDSGPIHYHMYICVLAFINLFVFSDIRT